MKQPIVLSLLSLLAIVWWSSLLCVAQPRYQSSVWIAERGVLSRVTISSPDSSGAMMLVGNSSSDYWQNYSGLQLSEIDVNGRVKRSTLFKDRGSPIIVSGIFDFDSVFVLSGRVRSNGLIAFYTPGQDSLRTVVYEDLLAILLHVLQLPDGYLLVGSDKSGKGVYVVRTDWEGEPIWVRTFGASNISAPKDVKQHVNGNIFIVGNVEPNSFNKENDIYALSIDLDGYLHWATYIGSDGVENETCAGLTFDKGDLLVGGAFKGHGYEYETPALYRISVDGNLLDVTAYRTSGDASVQLVKQFDKGELTFGGTIEDETGEVDNFIFRTPLNASETTVEGWTIGGDSTESLIEVEQFQGDLLLLGTSLSYGTNRTNSTTLSRTNQDGKIGCNDYPLSFSISSLSSVESEWVTDGRWKSGETEAIMNTYIPDTIEPRLVIGEVCRYRKDFPPPITVPTFIRFSKFDSLLNSLSFPQQGLNGDVYAMAIGRVDDVPVIHLLQFDSGGAPIKNYTYGWTTKRQPQFHRFKLQKAYPSEDGGTIIFARRDPEESFGNHLSYMSFLMKIDAEGYHDYTKYLFERDDFVSVTQASNNQFLVAASKYIARVNESGEVDWAYVNTSDTLHTGPIIIRELANGDFLLGGTYIEPDSKKYHSWLARYDSTAKTLWSFVLRRANLGDRDKEIIHDARETPSGDILFCGESGERALVGKVYADGELAWTIAYERQYGVYGHQIFPSNNGGGVVVGGSFIFRFDSIGTILWAKEFRHGFPKGVIQNEDGSFTFVGESNCPRSSNSTKFIYSARIDSNGRGGDNTYDVALYQAPSSFQRIDSNVIVWENYTVESYDLENPGERKLGFIADANCDQFDTTVGVHESLADRLQFAIEPNYVHVGGRMYIHLAQSDLLSTVPAIEVLDIRGRLQKSESRTIGTDRGETLIELHTEGLLPGIYFVKVQGTYRSYQAKIFIY